MEIGRTKGYYVVFCDLLSSLLSWHSFISMQEPLGRKMDHAGSDCLEVIGLAEQKGKPENKE